MGLKAFSKNEIKALLAVFGVLLVVSIPNFAVSIKRSRDLTRKNDIRDLAEAANKFQEKYFYFPGEVTDLAEFLPAVPDDPQTSSGVAYLYISNGSRYQIFASLEDKNQDEYDLNIEERNLSCGVRICNFGRAYGKTPLDKSIEEYENELYEKQL